MKEKLFKRASLISLVVIVLSLAALFIPQSFINFQSNAERSYSGLEVFFHFNWAIGNNTSGYLANNLGGRVSAAGIVFLSLSVLAAVCFVFAKKTTALKLFGGILEVLASIVMLSMELWMLIIYPNKNPVVLWVAYVFGGLLLLAGALAIWASVVDLKQEKQQAFTKKGYSYLKNK